MTARIALALIVCLALTAGLLPAAEWAQFRGPNGSGVVEQGLIPIQWSADHNVAWKVALPGAAWSCPIVWKDKIFITTAVTEKQEKPKPFAFGGPGGFGPPGGGFPREGAPPERGGRGGRAGRGGFGRGFGPGGMGSGGPPPNAVYRFEVHCLDRATGKTLWKQVAAERKPAIPTHPSNTFASETPVTDGQFVYAYFGMHGVHCFDLEGKPVWKKDLGAFPMQAGWGTGSSPALEGGRLFILCDNEKESFLVALDARTGNELWKTPREERSTWTTPFVWRNSQRTEVVAMGANRIRSYNPETGALFWELGGLSGTGPNATPVASEELLYVGNGGMFGNSPLFAIKAGAAGDITLPEGKTSSEAIAWSRLRAGPSMASPLLYNGYLYILEQRGGMLSCYDDKTGEPAYYRKRIPDAQGYTSSPWAYDGKLFCLDESGQTAIIKAGPEFEVLGKNTIEEMCWSSPAFADGALLLRTVDHLYCIQEQ